MKTEYQNLDNATVIVDKSFRKNPNRSISALFRYLRKHPRYTQIGCYPILATITHGVLNLGLKLHRAKVRYALNQSEELKMFSKNEKNILINQLINSSYVQTKHTKNGSIFDANRKDDQL